MTATKLATAPQRRFLYEVLGTIALLGLGAAWAKHPVAVETTPPAQSSAPVQQTAQSSPVAINIAGHWTTYDTVDVTGVTATRQLPMQTAVISTISLDVSQNSDGTWRVAYTADMIAQETAFGVVQTTSRPGDSGVWTFAHPALFFSAAAAGGTVHQQFSRCADSLFHPNLEQTLLTLFIPGTVECTEHITTQKDDV